MLKKVYISPQSETIRLETEVHILAGSVTKTVDMSNASSSENVTFHSFKQRNSNYWRQ